VTGGEEFARLTQPFRRELLVHCYRMLGSVDDAEDLVQETYLRAWRSFGGFEHRSSLRVWLYRIATTACLTALEHRSRRPLPSGLSRPGEDPDRPLPAAERGVSWLQPWPDAKLPADPAAVVAARGSLRLALVAAMQHLPARQRAVLILRDVLDWRAAEVAEVLGTSTAAVNSALQRARAQLEAAAPVEDELVEPDDPRRRALLDRYVAAFERADLPRLLALLTEDVSLEMPPYRLWFAGREPVVRFLAGQCLLKPGKMRLVATGANGQPAVGAYERGADGPYHAQAVHVLNVRADGISGIVAFFDPALFAAFGLAPVIGADSGTAG
jgi:RNA polymerase sigma-70 factor (ECF subfamily)